MNWEDRQVHNNQTRPIICGNQRKFKFNLELVFNSLTVIFHLFRDQLRELHFSNFFSRFYWINERLKSIKKNFILKSRGQSLPPIICWKPLIIWWKSPTTCLKPLLNCRKLSAVVKISDFSVVTLPSIRIMHKTNQPKKRYLTKFIKTRKLSFFSQCIHTQSPPSSIVSYRFFDVFNLTSVCFARKRTKWK